MEKNIPYVVQRNELGEITSPIARSYVSTLPNRKQRRAHLQKDRFHGESKNHHLTVLKIDKYLRHRQKITLKDGSVKFVLHYIEKHG